MATVRDLLHGRGGNTNTNNNDVAGGGAASSSTTSSPASPSNANAQLRFNTQDDSLQNSSEAANYDNSINNNNNNNNNNVNNHNNASGNTKNNNNNPGDNSDAIPDNISAHGSNAGSTHLSSKLSSSHQGKDALVAKMLEMVPGKDRDELLYHDVDEERTQGQRDQNAAEELEELARDLDRQTSFFAELLDNPFVSTIVINSHSQQIIWTNNYSSFLFNLVESDLIGEDVSLVLGVVPGRNNKDFHRRKISHFMAEWSRRRAQPESKIVSGRIQEVIACRYEGIKKINFAAQVVIRPMRMASVGPESPPFAFVGYIRDYSVEKMMRATLHTYQFLSEEATESIIILNTHGVIKQINKSAAKLFGYDAKFLVNTEANISLLMPAAIASVHDRYLRAFREKLLTPGYDIRTSPIVSKPRDLMARRSDGADLPIQLRVEYHVDDTNSGGDRLIGYLRDRRALIKAEDFNVEVSKRLFPESIAKLVSQKSEVRLVETHKNIPVILLDMVGFTEKTQNMDHDAVFELVNKLYGAAAEIAVGYQVEVVKATGDGVIAVCGIDEFDDPRSRMERAVCYALELLNWTHQQRTPIRVGIGYGELGSAVFEISKGRHTWDVWAHAINEASRMEHHAHTQTLQITMAAHKAIKDQDVKALFFPREHAPGAIHGVTPRQALTPHAAAAGAGGGARAAGLESYMTFETARDLDFAKTKTDVCDKVLNAALSRVFLKRENARELQEQQERRALTQQ